MTNITKALHWRYATKKFDLSKKISPETLTDLKESIRLAPSSYGLQPYTIIDVSIPEIREKLKDAAYGQTQLTDASHLFVFAVPTDMNEAHADEFISAHATIRNVPVESLAGYAGMIKDNIASKTTEQKIIWAEKQAYIALGFLLETAALLEVDAAPMEGFEAAKFDEILGLKAKNLTTAVICPIGYRAHDDEYANQPKVRKTESELFLSL
ncbi:MAG: NAD(P)H-dependent oxidoreductase [Patescibacteria group bacterium]